LQKHTLVFCKSILKLTESPTFTVSIHIILVAL